MSKPAIKLSPERHEQIKAIGVALDLSIVETVAHMVNSEIAKGTIPAGIKGVTVKSTGDAVTIAFDDQPPVMFTLSGVSELSENLLEFTEAGKRAQKLVNMKHNFEIERKGNGVKLTIPFTGKVTKSFPRDLARDLANILADAA